MELILAIAIGLTIWRLVKYLSITAALDKQQLPPLLTPNPTGMSPYSLAVGQSALSQKRKLWIKYKDSDGRISERNIEVYDCSDNLYLFAWCCLRNEPRTFRIDHILECKLLNERFQQNITAEKYIREQLLSKNWSSKVPWDEWQKAPVVKKVSPTRDEVSTNGEKYWVPPGQAVLVNGYKIQKGGVLVGTGLRALNGFRGPEPALIDPKMPVDSRSPDKTGMSASHLSSYGDLSPACRAGYLEWLSDVKHNGDVHVAFPLLFLYGFERRLFENGNPLAHQRAELDYMQRELMNLLRLYGKVDSFEKYATSFLEIVEICRDKENLYKTSPPMEKTSDYLPARIQVVVSQFASSGDPLPIEWALSWTVCHPQVRLRTPARRCRDEFKELFQIRYKDEFKGGIQIRPGKGTLKLRYRPASPSFGNELTIQTTLPHVPALQAIPAKLLELVERCIDELDAYSRHVGNKGSAETDLSSIALLPMDLVRQHQGRASLEFRVWIESRLANGNSATTYGQALLERWGKQDKPSKADCVLLSQVLEKWHFGMEPDVRFGGPTIRKDSNVVLFCLNQGSPATPSPEYALATVLLHLGVTVAMADGVLSSDEQRRLERQIESVLKIGPTEQQRLGAHLRWLCLEKPPLLGISKRIEPMNTSQKTAMAQFLITVAGADGYVTAPELNALSKIYTLLGFPREQVHADLHGLSLPDSSVYDGLVTIRKAEPHTAGYRVPKLGVGGKKNGFTLDMEKVQAKFAETAAVSAMLAGIFPESESPATVAPQDARTIGSLDARHSQLLMALVERDTWDRSALEEVAASLNLMPDGALEIINEASFDTVGEPLWEGEDPIYINVLIAKEMMACRTSK